MDKIDKIKAYLENQKAEYRLGKSAEAKYRMEVYTELLDFINSFQEEPVSDDLEQEIQRHLKDCLDVKFPTTDIESIKKDVEFTARHFANWQKEQFEKNRLAVCDKPLTFKAIPRLLSMVKPSRKAKAYCEKLEKSLEHEGYLVDAKIVNESIKIMDGEKVPMATMDEEPASEKYACRFSSSKYGHDKVKDAFIAGANWQKEQFEKNRLAACDAQTPEEAEREMNFATNIIEKEHRNPTFDDAIKYGMRLQQMKDNQDESDMALIAALDGAERGRKAMKAELMKNAIDGHIINDDGTHKLICPSLPIITRDMEEGDRVKVIVLKEEQQ